MTDAMDFNDAIWLQEAGVFYTWDKVAGPIVRNEFQWRHAETGKTGHHTVYTDNKADFLTLMAYWNRDPRWAYTLVSQTDVPPERASPRYGPPPPHRNRRHRFPWHVPSAVSGTKGR